MTRCKEHLLYPRYTSKHCRDREWVPTLPRIRRRKSLTRLDYFVRVTALQKIGLLRRARAMGLRQDLCVFWAHGRNDLADKDAG